MFSVNRTTTRREIPFSFKVFLYFQPIVLRFWNLKKCLLKFYNFLAHTNVICYFQVTRSPERDNIFGEHDSTEYENQPLEPTEQSISILVEDGAPPEALDGIPPALQTSITKKRRLSKLSKVENVIDKLQKLTDNRPSVSKAIPADEVELFGKYVATQLRDLPIRNRLILQDKIQSMLTRERLSLLSATPPQYSPMLSNNSSVNGGESDDNTDFTI